MRLFSVVTERGVGSLVFEVRKMFLLRCVMFLRCRWLCCQGSGLVASNFIYIFCMTFPCQPRTQVQLGQSVAVGCFHSENNARKIAQVTRSSQI